MSLKEPLSERWWVRVLMGLLLVGSILAACAGEASKEHEETTREKCQIGV